MLVLVGIIIILIVIVFFFVFKQKNKNIPKILWTYWDSEQLPPFIQRCIKTWRDKNPDYTIHVLNMNNLSEFLSTYEINKMNNWYYNDSHQRFSDLVRLNILAKHGGIWLDASIVCYESFNWVNDKENTGKCILYSIPELSKVPLLESWFIACEPGNEFVTEWRDEFMSVEKFYSIAEYVKYCNIDMTGINYPDYLLVYVCARKTYLNGSPDRIKIMNATAGPYNYHAQGGIHAICNVERPKFFKFRKEDRAALTDEHMKCIFDL